jgi:hypothetical protein
MRRYTIPVLFVLEQSLMNEKPKKLPPQSNNNQPVSLVTIVLVIAILGLLATIILRSISPTTRTSETNFKVQSAVDSGTAPIIERVVLREVWRDNLLIVYQDIYFSDADGDAAQVDFTLLETTAEEVYVDDGIVSERPQEQQEGAVHTAIWTCHSGRHTVTLQVELIDQNDNRSAPYQFTVTCRN